MRVKAHLRDHIFRQPNGPPRGKSQTPCPLVFKRRARPGHSRHPGAAGRGYRKAPRFSTRMFAARKRSRPRLLLAERRGNVIVYRRVRNGRAWRAPQRPEKGSRDEAAETPSNLESEHQWPTLRALTSPRTRRCLSEPHHTLSGGARRGPDVGPLSRRVFAGVAVHPRRGIREGSIQESGRCSAVGTARAFGSNPNNCDPHPRTRRQAGHCPVGR